MAMSARGTNGKRPAMLGGAPACAFSWPLWPVVDGREERLVLEVLRSGQWWFGAKVREFEAAFATFQGAGHGVTCTNGTAAIEMGLRALGVVEGDEVIVPAYTFIATATAAVSVGAIPVFADIDQDTLCLDVADFERKITPRTRAVVPVHVAGRMVDMDPINALAARHGIAVLEDAAHAWGSQWQGKGAGTLGRCGTFSFQVSKNITAGEGGILVTNDEDLAELCRSYTHCGRRRGSAWYDHDVLGSNLRLTEFQAAVLLAQLTRLEDQIRRRAGNAARLEAALKDVAGIRFPSPEPRMTRRSYHFLVFRVDESELGLSRDRFIQALNAEGVPVAKGWYRPLYQNGVFRNAHQGPVHGITAPLAGKGVDYRRVSCPVCEQVCRDAVWIPQHVLLADPPRMDALVEAVDKVAACTSELRQNQRP
jgi:dTDP-4-amino-4,6-dideoxygalactose transaminase